MSGKSKSSSVTHQTNITDNSQIGIDLGDENLFVAAEEFHGDISVQRVDAELLAEGAKMLSEAGSSVLGYASDQTREASDLARDVVRHQTDAMGMALDFASDSTGRALDVVTDSTGRALDIAADSAGHALDSALSFARDSGAESYDFARFIADTTTRAAETSRIENTNLARHLSETAISQVALSRKDQSGEGIESLGKLIIITGGAVAAAYLLTHK